MKKGGIIAIVAMAIVIVVLVIALIVTNLPKKEVVEVPENTTPVVEEKADTPTYLSLDGEVAKKATMILVSENGRSAFYDTTSGEITLKDLTNEDIQKIAYNYFARKTERSRMQAQTEPINHDGHSCRGTFTKAEMDEMVKDVFGDVEYTPTYITYGTTDAKIVEYYDHQEKYHEYSGFGGGPLSKMWGATISVVEYSDRYEVIQKAIYLDQAERMVYSFIKNENSTPLGDFDVTGVEVTHQYCNLTSSTDDFKIIEKYYDQAMTYKHTFMKNEDGSYYWVKSEVVK